MMYWHSAHKEEIEVPLRHVTLVEHPQMAVTTHNSEPREREVDAIVDDLEEQSKFATPAMART
jgi:hypothetical protein